MSYLRDNASGLSEASKKHLDEILALGVKQVQDLNTLADNITSVNTKSESTRTLLLSRGESLTYDLSDLDHYMPDYTGGGPE